VATGQLDALQDVIDEVVGAEAIDIDRDGRFPRAGIEALARAGLMAPAPLRSQCEVIERLAAVCGSTAMVVLMHYAAAAMIDAAGADDVKAAIAEGRHLSTLAFSEAGRGASSGHHSRPR
jgi:alkylation response protein AidB-like acyl-CoA dehydrogenase